MVLFAVELFAGEGPQLFRRVDIVRQLPLPLDVLQVRENILHILQVLAGQVQAQRRPLFFGVGQHNLQYLPQPSAAPIPDGQIVGTDGGMGITDHRHILHNGIKGGIFL